VLVLYGLGGKALLRSIDRASKVSCAVTARASSLLGYYRREKLVETVVDLGVDVSLLLLLLLLLLLQSSSSSSMSELSK